MQSVDLSAIDASVPSSGRTACYTLKPVCNDHLYDKVYYPWFIQ